MRDCESNAPCPMPHASRLLPLPVPQLLLAPGTYQMGVGLDHLPPQDAGRGGIYHTTSPSPSLSPQPVASHLTTLQLKAHSSRSSQLAAHSSQLTAHFAHPV